MKIGLICPYNIIKGGGVQEIVKAQQAELIRRGHDAYIITPRPQDYEGEPAERMIFVGGAANFNTPIHTVIQVSASVRESVEEMLEEHQFDILHFHEPWVPMLSSQILSRSKAVNVATFHAKLPETMMTRTMGKVVTPYTKPILKYIDALTAPSEAAADYVCSLTDEPVAIIPNGIDVSQFKPPRSFGDKRKQKKVLYVGRLEGRKGVKYLIHAFKILSENRPNVSLVIAGDGPDRDKLEMLADDLDLNDRVTFLGFVSHEDKLKLYRSCDLYCSPALFGESFGVVLLEAMASGLVTVAGDNPGYAAVMRGLGAISLVNPKHTAEFARRLDLLLHETDLRKLWRDWAAKEIPEYTYEHVVGQYLEVYEEALARAAKEHGKA